MVAVDGCFLPVIALAKVSFQPVMHFHCGLEGIDMHWTTPEILDVFAMLAFSIFFVLQTGK